MLVVGHAVKTWSTVCLMAPHSKSSKGPRYHHAWTNRIFQNQSEAIDLNPSFSKKAHSNKLGVGHKYKSTPTEPGCILTILHVSFVIRPLDDTRLLRSIQLSSRARDKAAVHNVLAQHPIFASRLSSVTREDTIFYAMPQKMVTKS